MGLAKRLDAAELRLATLARTPLDQVLGHHTAPDPPTGETWEWGQVWAHLAEFIPYWLAQAQTVIDGYHGEPVPFGRVKSDAGRVAAIERDRATAVAALWTRLQAHIAEARAFLSALPDQAWSARGAHQTLGVMSLEHLLDEFIVGHLEQHADQLGSLLAR